MKIVKNLYSYIDGTEDRFELLENYEHLYIATLELQEAKDEVNYFTGG